MPAVQGYVTGSQTSDYYNATITPISGAKLLLDTSLYLDNGSIIGEDNSLPINFSSDTAKVVSNKGDNLRTSNVSQEELLEAILLELKKINIQLITLTDEQIAEEEMQPITG